MGNENVEFRLYKKVFVWVTIPAEYDTHDTISEMVESWHDATADSYRDENLPDAWEHISVKVVNPGYHTFPLPDPTPDDDDDYDDTPVGYDPDREKWADYWDSVI